MSDFHQALLNMVLIYDDDIFVGDWGWEPVNPFDLDDILERYTFLQKMEKV